MAMKYGKAREIIAEARKTFAQRSASLIGRMGGSPEEVRQGITGKRTPAAKSGRALLTKARKAAERKREKDPYFPYGKAETRRMSKYMSEAQLDELSDSKLRGYAMKSAYNAAVDAPTHGVKKRLKGIGTALKKLAGYRSKKK